MERIGPVKDERVRRSPRKLTIDSNVRCARVYPAEGSKKAVNRLKTVDIKMNRDQAIHVARVLLAVSQEWNHIEITAYRTKPRKSDNTHQITVSFPN